MFGIGKKKRDVEKSQDSVTTPIGNTLILRVDSMGWCARLLNSEFEQIWEASEDLPRLHNKQDQPTRNGNMIKRALKVIEENALAKEGYSRPLEAKHDRAYLLLEGETFAYTDSRHPIVESVPNDQINVFGKHTLGVEKICCGDVTHNNSPTACFADMVELQNYLEHFEENAVKIAGILPIASLLMHELTQKPDAAFWMGSEKTLCLFSDPGRDSLVIRNIPVGLLHFSEAIKDKMGLTPFSAAETLSKRDHITTLDFEVEPANRRPAEQALIPLLQQLHHELHGTLDYFVSQRLGSEPIAWSLYGGFSRIQGLNEWLSNDFPVQLEKDDSLNELQSVLKNNEIDTLMNLLDESEDDLVTVGRISYTFADGRFLPTNVVKRDRFVRSIGQLYTIKMPWSKRRDSVEHKEAAQQEQAEYEVAAPSTADERPYFAGLIAVLCLALYWGYDQYETMAKRYESQATAYERNLASNSKVNESLYGLSESGVRLSSADDDTVKVYWAEKFLELGAHMEEHIWFTDVYLAEDTASIGGDQVLTKKLVMEGAVLPSTDGHIMKIAEYVARLESNREKHGFMSDFRKINFVEAVLADDEEEQIIKFKLEAVYDKNKRIEVVSEDTNVEKGKNPLQDLKDATKAREKETQKILKPGFDG